MPPLPSWTPTPVVVVQSTESVASQSAPEHEKKSDCECGIIMYSYATYFYFRKYQVRYPATKNKKYYLLLLHTYTVHNLSGQIQ